jgi:hypothetical protein
LKDADPKIRTYAGDEMNLSVDVISDVICKACCWDKGFDWVEDETGTVWSKTASLGCAGDYSFV